jgi:sulfopyruvate decarboxylase TPP-binding subunit
MKAEAAKPSASPLAAAIVVDAIREVGATHVVTVPDTTLRTVLRELDATTGIPVVRVATEDDVLGVCAGLWMTGQKPIALIQQLGLFASVNALRAFTHDHCVPLAILAGLYGRDVRRPVDVDQPSAVRLCIPLLDVLGVRWALIEGPDDEKAIAAGLAAAFDERCTSAVLIGATTG